MFQIDMDLLIILQFAGFHESVMLSIRGVAALSLTFNKLVSQSWSTGWAEYPSPSYITFFTSILLRLSWFVRVTQWSSKARCIKFCYCILLTTFLRNFDQIFRFVRHSTREKIMFPMSFVYSFVYVQDNADRCGQIFNGIFRSIIYRMQTNW